MRDSSLLYRVLRLVHRMEEVHCYPWPPLTLLCARLGEPWARVMSVVKAMADRGWDADDKGNPHPWLTYNRQARTTSITADGKAALDAARERPHLYAEKWHGWIDQKRWPVGGCRWEDRPLDDTAAIPTGGTKRGGGRCPEGAAMIDLARMFGVSVAQVTSMVMNGRLKYCPRCFSIGGDRRCIHPIEDYGLRRGGEPDSWCKSCRAEAVRERRAK